MSTKLKVKWMDQMNEDLLQCKRKAQELVSLCEWKEKGIHRGDAKGYGNPGLKAPNLWDQASRIEKIQERSMDTTSGDSRGRCQEFTFLALDFNQKRKASGQ